MIVIYNGKKYTATDESIYTDFSVCAESIEEAVEIVRDLMDMSDYTFDLKDYSGMVVRKRMIIFDERGVTVRMIIREKTKAEKAQEELDSLRMAMEDLAQNVSKTNAAKINKILANTGGNE